MEILRKYSTIVEVEAHNKAIGRIWFQPGAMKFFNSKIESGIIKGRYFISSEKGPLEVRMYSVRLVLNGKIETVGKFNAFFDKTSAKDFIKELPDLLPEALELATNSFNKGDNSFMHNVYNYNANELNKACKWLVDNYEKIDAAFIRHYNEEFYNVKH